MEPIVVVDKTLEVNIYIGRLHTNSSLFLYIYIYDSIII
jgi:hypothetical protein